MQFTLHCCHCGQTFQFKFSKSADIPDMCPICHNKFDPYEWSVINDFLDKIDAYNKRFTSLKIKQLSETTSGSNNTSASDNVFSSDLRSLNRLYDNAPSEQRELLSSIIDKLYLLLNRDVRAGSSTFPSSQRVYDLLKKEFFHGIESNSCDDLLS